MKTSAMLKVGFQKREDTYSSKLGFIIPADEITSNRNFTRWINNQIPIEDIKNVPRSGFVLNKNIKRNFSYSSSEKMRVFHPDGFEFEINMSNLSFILLNTNISAQEIMCDCVIGWFRGSVYLVPAHTEEGKDIINQNNVFRNISQIEIGCGLKINDKSFFYAGNHLIHGVKKYVLLDPENSCYVDYAKLPEFDEVTKPLNEDSIVEINVNLKKLLKLDIKRHKISAVKLLSLIYKDFHAENNKQLLSESKQANLALRIFKHYFSYFYELNIKLNGNNVILERTRSYSSYAKIEIPKKTLIDFLLLTEDKFIEKLTAKLDFSSLIMLCVFIHNQQVFIDGSGRNIHKIENIVKYLEGDFSTYPDFFNYLK